MQAAATSHALAGFQVGIEQGLDRRAQEFVDTNAPALLAAFVEPFDRAADVIATALEKLGDVDLNADAAAILSKGGDSAAVWAGARDADEAIRAIHQAWGLLGAVTSSVPFSSRYRVLVIADPPAETFIADELANVTVTAWEAARKGYPLVLANPATYRERVAAVPVAQAARQAAGEQAFRDASRRRYGSGGGSAA